MVSIDLDSGIEAQNTLLGCQGLWLSYMTPLEQELSIQVAHIDGV